jgi:hypothetical protein
MQVDQQQEAFLTPVQVSNPAQTDLEVPDLNSTKPTKFQILDLIIIIQDPRSSQDKRHRAENRLEQLGMNTKQMLNDYTMILDSGELPDSDNSPKVMVAVLY